MDAVAAQMVANSPANPTSLPVSQQDVVWARCRRPHERTPMPVAGQQVGYRHYRGGPVTEAEIENVDISDLRDFNVWRFVLDQVGKPVELDGQRLMEMVDDPWPDVWLRTDYGRVITREARIEGTPGWLPKRQG